MHSLKLTPVNDIIYTDFDEAEGILVDLNTKQYYRLNETGSLIWRGLEKGNTVDEIVSQMQAAYEVSADHARASVEELLTNLESNKLVKRL
ncbi:MAG TPA: PqqD family protein [Pyrinomonadaceae bacterium]|jgi:hypothetical protein